MRVQVALEVAQSEMSARLVKARLEKTTLGQVAQSITMILQGSQETPPPFPPQGLRGIACSRQ